MTRVPELVYADDIMMQNGPTIKLKGYTHWAKPYGDRILGIKHRCILAWMVFKGECDALRYAEDFIK